MKKTFEKEVPEGYRTALTVDAKDTRLGIIMNIIALIIAAATVAVTAAIVKPADFIGNFSPGRNFLLAAALIPYMVLHELVHGIAYKLLTKQKLKFGLTLTVAFCGVPDIYVYRRTALIALLAPFVSFTIVFLLLIFLLPEEWDKVYASVMLGLHIGGCCGDLYDTFLYLFKFKAPDTLMRDTGPKQTFYLND